MEKAKARCSSFTAEFGNTFVCTPMRKSWKRATTLWRPHGTSSHHASDTWEGLAREPPKHHEGQSVGLKALELQGGEPGSKDAGEQGRQQERELLLASATEELRVTDCAYCGWCMRQQERELLLASETEELRVTDCGHLRVGKDDYLGISSWSTVSWVVENKGVVTCGSKLGGSNGPVKPELPVDLGASEVLELVLRPEERQGGAPEGGK
eukprot:gene20092-24052_t